MLSTLRRFLQQADSWLVHIAVYHHDVITFLAWCLQHPWLIAVIDFCATMIVYDPIGFFAFIVWLSLFLVSLLKGRSW